jgi:hypothetical protein
MILLQELDTHERKNEFIAAFKKWQSTTGGVVLFRGINSTSLANAERSNPSTVTVNDVEIQTYEFEARKDRKPKDSSLQLHKLLDKWLFDETGIKFRSEGVFTSKSKMVARYYGDTFVIIPKGKFHYCWSPYIRDTYTMFDHKGSQKFSQKSSQELSDFLFSKSTRKILDPIAKKMGIEESDIPLFIDAMLTPKKFGAKKVISILSQLPGIWNFDKGLLECPLENDVMIACDSYYLVSLTDYEFLVKNL